ncbi:YDG domain-containing protein [Mesorhizobium denitrificans]|nr:YDG domain-containing protein [Mesorhizobium denitrificans]
MKICFSHFVPSSRSTNLVRSIWLSLLASTSLTIQPVLAQDVLPTGGNATAGSVVIGTTGNTMTVRQATDKAIVNWNGFNVGAGKKVDFVQPGSGSAILNRVTGSTPSTVAGQITGNGQVYLINPNGIAITQTGTVKVGSGFVASTLDITDKDFLAGTLSFKGNGASANVSNAGVVTVGRGGYAALLGGTVQNSGLIAVPLGKAGLGSGERATLDLSGDGFLQVALPTKDGAEGNGALITNSGEISAEGGTVVISAATAREAARNAVNLSGVVEANTISGRSGAIVIGGGDGGAVKVSGKVRAKAASAKGGTVTITGKDVALQGAKIDVSGAAGGGTVKVGGDWQGSAGTQRADTTSVDNNTTINADATDNGSGGKVVIWSDYLTTFDGNISSRGAGEGNGGDAEVSGKAVLSYTGKADLSAENGSFGNLLLDPYNLTISLGTNNNLSGFSANGDDSILNVSTLLDAPSFANVTVSTGTSGGQDGDITVAAPIWWSDDTTLTLQADGNINFNADVITTGTNAGLVIQTGNGKDYTFGNASSITLSGANATLNIGGVTYVLVHDADGLDSISNDATLSYALAQDLDLSDELYETSVIANNSQDRFSGTLAGLGNTISNLTINSAEDNVGFIGSAFGAVIRDIGITSGSITGSSDTGALIGNNEGSVILHAYSRADVTGQSEVGGLIGKSNGGSQNFVYATGNVTGTGIAGGLVGMMRGSAIKDSYASGSVTGAANVGGLVGSLSNDDYSTHSTITRSYATGSVTSVDMQDVAENVGGLAGNSNEGEIRNSYATGKVSIASGTSSDANDYLLGGLVGDNYYGTIENSYATGEVDGAGCLSLSCVYGGIAGRSVGAISNAYWDTGTSGVSIGIGSDPTSPDAISMSTADAFKAQTYSGFDFAATWYMLDDSLRPFLMSEWSTTIANGHQLQLMSLNLGASYALANDIDLADTMVAAQMWNIDRGFASVGSEPNQFIGTFDGAGHTISNLYIDQSSISGIHTGLFGFTAESSNISNVGLVGGDVIGNDFATGSLAGVNYGTIKNVYATTNVAGSLAVGGLVGSNNGTISVAYASGTITVGAGGSVIGGLVGTSSGTISDAYATGNILNDGDMMGGLVGENNSGTITRTYATGQISGTGNNIGQLVGSNTGDISGSYWLSNSLPGVASGGGTLTTSTDLFEADFQDTTNFLQTARTAGWNFETTWAPPSEDHYPELYALTPIVWASVVDTTSTYGDSGATIASLETFYGPDLYVFDPTGGDITFASAVIPVDSSLTAGTHAIDLAARNDTAVSASGINYRVFYFGQQSLSVGKATLTAALTGTVSKTYDGNTDASLDAENFQLTGKIGSDNVYIGATTGSYANANAVNGIGVSVVDLTLSGTAANNYVLDTTTLSETIGVILQAELTATLTGSVTKTFDGNDQASLEAENFQLTGIIGSDNVYLDATTGTYGIINAGENILVSVGGLELSGTAAENYVLNGVSLSDYIGTIQRASLDVALTGDVTKVYDGNSTASLGTANFHLTGIVGSDNVYVDSMTGTYGTASAGTGISVSVDGLGLSGLNSNNYQLSTTTLSDTIGVIEQATLNASLIGAVTKTYDGNTDASLEAENFQLTGIIGSDNVYLGPVTGTFSSANAGSNIGVSISDLALSGTAADNYVLDTTTLAANIGTIEQATLNATLVGPVTKIYDGNTDASLTSENFQLAGIVGSENVYIAARSGTYGSANAGASINVSVDGLTLSGTAADNYVLSGPSLSNEIGTIQKAALTVIANDAIKDGDGIAYSGGNGVAYSGFVNDETESVLLGALAYAGSSQGALNPGNYIISASGLTAENYDLTFVDGALTIRANANPWPVRIEELPASFLLGGLLPPSLPRISWHRILIYTPTLMGSEPIVLTIEDAWLSGFPCFTGGSASACSGGDL